LRGERVGQPEGEQKSTKEKRKLAKSAEHSGIIAMETFFYKYAVSLGYGHELRGITEGYMVRQGKTG